MKDESCMNCFMIPLPAWCSLHLLKQVVQQETFNITIRDSPKGVL